MDKFLNKIREAELEPNQNNAFPEEISSTSSGQKKKQKQCSEENTTKVIFCSDLFSLRMPQNLLCCT